MRSEQILGNPKEKIFGVEILTAKEKPLKKNIFPKKRKSTTGKWNITLVKHEKTYKNN